MEENKKETENKVEDNKELELSELPPRIKYEFKEEEKKSLTGKYTSIMEQAVMERLQLLSITDFLTIKGIKINKLKENDKKIVIIIKK